MNADVVFLPNLLTPGSISARAVVVFDVIRATTTMAAAFVAGVKEIRVFDSPAAAEAAAPSVEGSPLLCGEVDALPPPGFDLGNSPREFNPAKHAGRTLLMSTTNGTRAIVAARAAKALFVGALVNASATARAVAATKLDVTLLCAGTEGAFSIEDMLGAGAVLEALKRLGDYAPSSDAALIALQLFRASRDDLPSVLREGRGGQNVIRIGLEPDLDFASQMDSIDIAARVTDQPLTVRQVP